ncbi:NF-kappa-B-repressing factor isoform X2 [Sceloporus undulatus]|uniref:NF-kappa-B-repressing factor isoform X1 n=1 Tax=Sceloporus undulatus TaxID=8520 RepID=UPI001C4D7105|nr:NF-kappa-B-repressing factor isoform X1 [Sceloporus undulatus]XP_042336069.1 NF-kappa-B-repressing factor isoform X2 [Sceloporus undulatus]
MAGGGWAVPGGDLLGPQPPRPDPQQPPSPSPPSPSELECWREQQESEAHWALRRQFLVRNLADQASFPRLLALSHAWANHLFMGCRYGSQVMEKVLQMAEGIDVGTMPSFELVPGSKAAKRPRSALDESPSSNLAVPRKQAPKFRARPRFEPIHFVASNTQDKGKDESSENQAQVARENITTQQIQNYADRVFSSFSTQDCDGNFSSSMGLGFGNSQPEAKTVSKNKDTSAASDAEASGETSLLQSDSETFPKSVITAKQYFINKLVAAVRKNLTSPDAGGGPDKISYTYLLTRSIQACKTNPEYIYSPLKELSPADLPKSKKLLKDGFACEVRCQNVYLTTGYAGSKNGSRDRATELAVILLQKPVEVKVAQRKFKNTTREDLVLCESGTAPSEFPPALKQLDDFIAAIKECTPGQPNSDPQQGPSSGKHWTNFVLTENACDAIGILNNSASFNKMTVDYKYVLMPNRLWRCSVYLQDHFLAEGYGTKKTSKHAAADEALKILQKTQSNAGANKAVQVQKVGGATRDPSKKKDLKDLVVYENSGNPVCTLNDTAQFNKMTVEYIFERMTGMRWKCKVMLENELIAEAVGIKKIVKHVAAEEAVKVLKKTQPTVVNNLKKGTVEDVISRNEIRGRSAEEALKQQIKEDNIGNQILRKMGWTGGGLGKSGEGIREPIAVKEQFKREGLGLDVDRRSKITKKDIEQIIQNYAFSDSKIDLTFSTELTNEERKQIHQIAQKYGLKSKSHGQGRDRFLVVSRKRRREDLLDQLKQDGQVGHFELIMPQEK